MPQNPNIIATKSKYAHVYIFDRTKYPSKPNKGAKFNPTLTLTGHEKEGYGLEWNRHKEGYLLSSADDNLICLWDIKQIKSLNNSENSNNSNSKKKKTKIQKEINHYKHLINIHQELRTGLAQKRKQWRYICIRWL